VLYLEVAGWTDAHISAAGHLMEKLAASSSRATRWRSSISSCDSEPQRLRPPRRHAQLRHEHLGHSSQTLWQHGVTELLVVVALWRSMAAPLPSSRSQVQRSLLAVIVPGRPLAARFPLSCSSRIRQAWPFVIAGAARQRFLVAWLAFRKARRRYLRLQRPGGRRGLFLFLRSFPGLPASS
jgi:hypothetical protein